MAHHQLGSSPSSDSHGALSQRTYPRPHAVAVIFRTSRKFFSVGHGFSEDREVKNTIYCYTRREIL